MQFNEPKSSEGKCPVCGKPTLIRSTKEKTAYCSRVCASIRTHGTRYKGSQSGPADRPVNPVEKTKFYS